MNWFNLAILKGFWQAGLVILIITLLGIAALLIWG